MLADPAARGQILATDPNAAAIDRQVQGMAGSAQLAQEVYGLAAGLRGLARSTGGDPRQLSAALDRAKSIRRLRGDAPSGDARPHAGARHRISDAQR